MATVKKKDLVLRHEKRVEPVAHVGDSPLQDAPDHQGGGQGGSQGVTVVVVVVKMEVMVSQLSW